MPLISLQEYRVKFFSDDSRPAYSTVRKWAATGKLPVERRGRAYYVQTDRLNQVTGNPLVDRIMRKS